MGELQITLNGTVERKRKNTRTANGIVENGESASSNGVNVRRSAQNKNRDTIMGTSATNRNSTSSAAGSSVQQQASTEDQALPEGWEQRQDPYGRAYYVVSEN